MKPNRLLPRLLTLTGLLALPGLVHAQNTVTVDPADALTGYTSLGEWDTADDPEGWTVNQLDPLAVSGGVLSGTATGGDTQIVRNPLAAALPAAAPSVVTVDVRLRRPAADTTPLQLFWADNAGGFAAARSVTLNAASLPADGAMHTCRFTLTNSVNTQLKGLRLDASQTNGAALEFDYVRAKVVSGAPVIDPAQRVNVYTSLGEWNTEDLDGWTAANISAPATLQGALTGLTVGNDPQFIRTGLALDSTTGDYPIMEIRARKEPGETSRVDLFWADTAGGFAAVRKATIAAGQWPDDGEFHVFQVNLGPFFTGTVNAFRFDPVSDLAASKAVAVDYVRIGRIDTDTDGDGLADSVETDTGVFVSAADTGTDPADADSDDDTFNDGLEVSFGTDPNNPASVPTPVLTGYATSAAVYIRSLPVTENAPATANGTPTGFTVNPALPSGLQLNAATGVISGTPDTLTASAVYTVTATFAGGLTSDYALTLAVRDPGIALYGVSPASYNAGTPIATNAPVLAGPLPDSYSITPALPDGLFFDESDGTITGTPAAASPATDYTVTARYTGFPDASYVLSLRVKAVPVFVAVDAAPLGAYTSLGEWESGAGLDGWGFVNATGSAANGALSVTSTATDPQSVRGGLGYDPAGGTLLEIRLRQSDTDVVEIFWGDDNGGPAPQRRTTIPSIEIIGDGQFHTYQISFDGVFDGNLAMLRIDPGVNPGRTVDLDYVRIGTAGAAIPLQITGLTYDPLFNEVTLVWTSAAGSTYRIEATPDLVTPWAEVISGLSGDAGTTSFIDTSVPAGAPRRFYRVRRE